MKSLLGFPEFITDVKAAGFGGAVSEVPDPRLGNSGIQEIVLSEDHRKVVVGKVIVEALIEGTGDVEN